MGRHRDWAVWTAVLSLLAAPLAAQEQGAPPAPPLPPGAQGGQLPTGGAPAGGDTVAVAGNGTTRFIFEREVYSYPETAGRDPFAELTALADIGPTFEELTLLSTFVVSADPGRSVAAIRDAAGTIRNVRRGMVLGNVTILDIGRTQVVVAVDEFGIRRQEVLRLRPPTTGGTDS